MAIFYVEGNDAQTIAAAAAASIENAAEQRARAEADKTGGKPTMTFFASAQEAAVVIAANDLRAQYKEEFGLAKRPILLPYGSPLMPYQGQHNQGSRDGTFHHHGNQPTAQAFLDVDQLHIGSLDHSVKPDDSRNHCLNLQQCDCLFHSLFLF